MYLFNGKVWLVQPVNIPVIISGNYFNNNSSMKLKEKDTSRRSLYFFLTQPFRIICYHG